MHGSIEKSLLFRGVDTEAVEQLLDDTDYVTHKFDKDELIFYRGQTVSEMHLVLNGSVRGEMFGESGKVAKIDDLFAGELIAPAFMFGPKNYYPLNVTASESTETMSFAKQEFVKLLQNNGKILGNYLNLVSSKAQFLSRKLHFFTFKTIKEKFMFYVMDISKRRGSKNIRLPLSQEKLAELFGVCRPSLGRAIRELHDEGKITARGRDITIMNHSHTTNPPSLLLRRGRRE